MKKQPILPLLLLTIILFNKCKPSKTQKDSKTTFTINWVDKIDSNFDFTQKWTYPEGVYRNEFGQLTCDGICPVEIEAMKETNGRIKADSLEAFYEIIDTTHLFFSLESESNCPEFAGANFVYIERKSDQQITIYSETNAATHSTLNIEIEQSIYKTWVDLVSINPQVGNRKFNLKNGELIIDKQYWEQGVLKAEFNFEFDNGLKEGEEEVFFWRGRMYEEMGGRE